jgi:hypothetical protein
MAENAKLFSSSRERIWLFALVLVLATIFAYRPAWNGGFVWDDDNYVTKNRLLPKTGSKSVTPQNVNGAAMALASSAYAVRRLSFRGAK